MKFEEGIIHSNDEFIFLLYINYNNFILNYI